MKTSMKRFIIVVFVVCIFIVPINAQETITDRFYQDQVESKIRIGFELLEDKELNEGIKYLKEAVHTAEKRSHDYYLAAIVLNGNAIEPIIDFYYSLDSIQQARNYLDLYISFSRRFNTALLDNNLISNEDFEQDLATYYEIAGGMAMDNSDHEYMVRYNSLFIEIARAKKLFTDTYFLISENLYYDYFSNKQYVDALKQSISLFNDAKENGTTNEEYIAMARLAYSGTRISIFKSSTEEIIKAKKAFDIWFDFISTLYEDNGESYMDSLLMALDNKNNWEDEIVFEVTSTTLVASHLTNCFYSLWLDGYDASKQYLINFRKLLFDSGKEDLWPIVIFNFLDELQYKQLYSAEYGFCKLVENDITSIKGLPRDVILNFYTHYIDVCDRVGDITKLFDIIHEQFDNVDESDELYWFITRIKGSIYLNMGKNEEGLSCMLDALNHFNYPSEPLKADSSTYASLLTFIGQAYARLGKTNEAIDYINQGIHLYDQCNLEDNKLLPYHELGLLYYHNGDLEKSREYFKLCVEIQSETEVQYHASVPYFYLFDIERQNKSVDRARDYLSSMWQIILREFILFKDYLSVQEQTSYWEKEGEIISIGGLIAESEPYYNDIYYDILLSSKGFLLKEEIAEFNNVYNTNDNRLKELYNTTHNVDEATQKDIDDYLTLYRTYDFRSEIDNISWKSVQEQLSKGDLAIEFFKYELDNTSDGAQYGALLIKTGWKTPKFIHICSSKLIDVLAGDTKFAYSYDGILYDIIWKPLKKELKGIKNIYYSPQGSLHNLNLAAITSKRGVPMFEKYNMFRVSSTLNVGRIRNKTINKAYVYGGLVYDSDDETMLQEHLKFENTIEESMVKLDWETDSSITRRGWSYLPNTELEIKKISEGLKKTAIDVVSYSGTSGTEESFKAINNTHPDLIHLATHGYYLHYLNSDSTNTTKDYERFVGSRQNAMVRSGLILSNGGRAWKGETIPEGVEDGILQADEIANINLGGTSLLVLSACETALGDISSEGVYGLQRAFKKAGVETIIMSLWEVDDKATSLFMSYFYEAWLSVKNKHEAFVIAQKRLRNEFHNPYYWAPFIMLD